MYHIEGIIELKLQIVVTRELQDPELIPLKILMKNAAESAVRAFLEQKFDTPGDREDADAVLQISVSENRELFERIRGDKDMCQALRELMEDEIQNEITAERYKAREQTERKRIEIMLRDGKSPQQIADFCKYSIELVLDVQSKMLAMA